MAAMEGSSGAVTVGAAAVGVLTVVAGGVAPTGGAGAVMEEVSLTPGGMVGVAIGATWH